MMHNMRFACLVFLLLTVVRVQGQIPASAISPAPAPAFAPVLPGQLDPARSQIQATQQQNQRIRESATQTSRNREEQLRELRADLAATDGPQKRNAAFAAANKAQYATAYQALVQMLEGRRPCDLQQAVFTTENTYLSNRLDYAGFDKQLTQLAQLCRTLAADSLRPNPATRFLALHRLMTDTIRLRPDAPHYPPTYDFEDFRGEQDFTRQFVTKLLFTNSGQCRSLPLLYKLLADKLGVKAYLSLAPNHLYIQVKDNRGELYSYEATNGHFVSDAYYLGSGYIKAGALKNRSYLDTLTQHEALAFCLFDLAQGYVHRYGFDGFTDQCIDTGLCYYPQSVQGRMLAHDAAFLRFVAAWKKEGQPPPAALPKHPTLVPLYNRVQRLTRAVDELGHEDMPPEQYQQWLKQVDAEKNRIIERGATRRFDQSAH